VTFSSYWDELHRVLSVIDTVVCLRVCLIASNTGHACVVQLFNYNNVTL